MGHAVDVNLEPGLEFRYTDITDPLAKPLFDELSHEYSTRYGGDHSLDIKTSPEMKRYPPVLFRPPLGGFVLLLGDGVPISGGAFMPIDERTAEMKRIWTASGYRRRGLSSLVLQQLEGEIARRGYTRIYLTTGNRQPEARNLYLKAGYTPLFDLNATSDDFGLWPFEKVVVPVQPYQARGPRIREWLTAIRQRRAVARAWTSRNPIPLRLDDVRHAGAPTASTARVSHETLPHPPLETRDRQRDFALEQV